MEITEENESTGVIYKLTNTINGKIYIGQAKSYIQNHGKIIRHGLEGRWMSHKNDALSGKNSCPYLYAAIRKYNPDSFTREIIVIVLKENIDDEEIFYIKHYDSINREKGYNVIIRYAPKCDGTDNLDRIEKIKNSMLKRWQDPEYKEKTTKGNFKAVMARADSGKTRKKNKDLNLPGGIYKTKEGYNIQIMRNGKYKVTSVQGKKLTEEELLQKAIKKREEIIYNMDNNINDSHETRKDHNGNNLPKHMLRTYDGNYIVNICYPKEKVYKKFSDENQTLDQRLEAAKKFLSENI